MKYVLAAIIASFVSMPVMAKIWTVSPRPGADFATLTAAVGSASVLSGDTLLVSGAAGAYASVNINKKLTILGPGYFLGENTGLQADTNAASVSGNVTIQSGGAGTTIMGLRFLNSLYVDADNVTIRRCRMQVSTLYDYPVYVYTQDSVTIAQCFMTQTAQWYHCITVQTGSTNIFIRNNFVEYTGGHTSYGAISIQGTMTGDISNNVIYGDFDNAGGGFTCNNNILRSGTFSGTGVTPYNNIGDGTQFQAWADTTHNNQVNVNMSSVFVGSGSRDAQWQIQADGPADGTGFAGADCGMFDASENNAYVLSGIPSIPSIYEFTANSDLSNVTVKVKSNN
jgi:hypothetical protein